MLVRTGSNGNARHCWWKTGRWFLTKLNMLLPHDPAVTFLSVRPTEPNTCVHANTCTWMFTAALVITAKPGSNPDVLQQVTDKLWSIQTMEYHSALKRNELSVPEKTWRSPKCTSHERSQSEKATDYMIPTLWPCGEGRAVETVKRSVVVRGLRGKDDQVGTGGF